MRVFNYFKLVLIAALLSIGAGILVFPADAQTTHRRKTAKPTATPKPLLTDAEIISRAADQQEPPLQTSAPVKVNTPITPTDNTAAGVKDLSDRVKKLESPPKNDYEEKQKRLLMNLDI